MVLLFTEARGVLTRVLFFFLFFPTFSALERLHALKRAGSQIAINAREAVRFLDRVTSGKDNLAAERIILQGPMEQYEKWEDAEKFFLPEFEEVPEAIDQRMNGDGPALSEKQGAADKAKDDKKSGENGAAASTASPDDLSQMLLSRLNFKKESDAVSNASAGTHSGPASQTSSRSSRTSPECANGNGDANGEGSKQNKAGRANGHQRTASGSIIPSLPPVLRPLLSAVLWRLHSGSDTTNAASTGCILVSNDPVVQSWAQKFGVGVKNIHQLRTSIQYEEREYKNRCKYVEKTQGPPPEPKTILSDEEESDEDELVFVPRGRGKSATRTSGRRGVGNHRKPAASKTVAPPLEDTVDIPKSPIDPDSFSRSLGGSTGKSQLKPVELGAPSSTAKAVAGGTSRGQAGGRRGGFRGPSRGSGRGRGKLWVP